jgi:hypothetical protein
VTVAAQQLITAPIARKIMAEEVKAGNYFNLPTMGEVESFYATKKSWWSVRDLMVRKFNSMAMLEPPFGNDKDSQQDPAYQSEKDNNQDEYSVDPGPFDTVTQAISMAAKMRAYANPYPTDEKHTSHILQEYGKFGNAILDMAAKKRDYIPEDMSKLINTGWLIKSFPFDPQLQEKDEFPFQIETLSPLGVYPDMDIHNQVLRVCIERRLTGLQLLENYSSYQGVRELFDEEFGFGKPLPPADSSTYREWSSKKNNLLSTEFQVVRYYDRVCTAILISGKSATEYATKYNSALKSLKDKTKEGNKMVGIYTKAQDRDNPWYGVSRHNMGRVPMAIEFCWPEIRDASTFDLDGDTGRLGGLPLMWSGFSTWREISRYFSMLQNLLLKTASAPIVTNIENFTLDTDVIQAEGDQKAVYLQPPQVQQQIAEVMGRLQNSFDKGTFSPALAGMGAATSGRERNMVLNAGGVRFEHIVRKIGRAWGGTIEGITEILKESWADAPIKVWGSGKKYGGEPYVQKFKAVMVGSCCPGVSVDLKRSDAMVDPERIAIFKTVDGVLPSLDAYDQILEVPNPQQMYEAVKQEKMETVENNFIQDVELFGLKKQLELLPERSKVEWELQKQKDIIEHETRLKQTALDLSQEPSDVVEARQRAFIQQKMQEASQPPHRAVGTHFRKVARWAGTHEPSGLPGGMPPSMTGGSIPPSTPPLNPFARPRMGPRLTGGPRWLLLNHRIGNAFPSTL